MKTSICEGKHGIQQTAQNHLEDLDFVDDLSHLSDTYKQMQMKTTSVTAVSICISRLQHTQGNKQDPQIQHGEL
ncbi:unnamed protein product [Schistosoma margrebowiei]|uniref:Uncharacterized protein n=1 Tax=Schistosoma margrebowiei TaxID=48269 RepID=A0A183LTB2_9TREM|nr:unnamed protein product [Schistosoma margrebowiei]